MSIVLTCQTRNAPGIQNGERVGHSLVLPVYYAQIVSLERALPS